MEMSMNLISRQERIHHRSGHVAVGYGKYILVWGGYIPVSVVNYPLTFRQDQQFGQTVYHYMDEVWAYDTETELWHQWCTTGNTPPQLSGCVAVVIGRGLLVFGGFCHGDETRSGNSDRLYRLDLDTLEWRLLSPKGQIPTPCDKLVAWTYENKMYIFGGFGPTPTVRGLFAFQADRSTVYSNELRGWNNQLAAYDPSADEWEWPRISGTPPSPRAAHACDITGELVYIFGGRFMTKRTNDLFCLNLKTKKWSANLTDDTTGPVPVGRSWHSFTFVSPGRAILYGGLENRQVVMRSCWELDVERVLWRKLRNARFDRRHWHTACLAQRRDQVFFIGGTIDKVEEMLHLDFTPKTLLRLCLDITLSSLPKAAWQNGCVPRSVETILQLRHETKLTHKRETSCT